MLEAKLWRKILISIIVAAKSGDKNHGLLSDDLPAWKGFLSRALCPGAGAWEVAHPSLRDRSRRENRAIVPGYSLNAVRHDVALNTKEEQTAEFQRAAPGVVFPPTNSASRLRSSGKADIRLKSSRRNRNFVWGDSRYCAASAACPFFRRVGLPPESVRHKDARPSKLDSSLTTAAEDKARSLERRRFRRSLFHR